MSIVLQEFRLFITTEYGRNDGTDDSVFLDFNIKANNLSSYPYTGWKRIDLNNSGDDREPGNTDLYDVKFYPVSASNGGITVEIAIDSSTTVHIPPGIAFDGFEDLRGMPFFLILGGNDKWRIKHYFLMGHIVETWVPPNAIDSNKTYDHGWILMASNDTSFCLSGDPSEAPSPFHVIDINAVFPPKREPDHYGLSQYIQDQKLFEERFQHQKRDFEKKS